MAENPPRQRKGRPGTLQLNSLLFDFGVCLCQQAPAQGLTGSSRWGMQLRALRRGVAGEARAARPSQNWIINHASVIAFVVHVDEDTSRHVLAAVSAKDLHLCRRTQVSLQLIGHVLAAVSAKVNTC